MFKILHAATQKVNTIPLNIQQHVCKQDYYIYSHMKNIKFCD